VLPLQRSDGSPLIHEMRNCFIEITDEEPRQNRVESERANGQRKVRVDFMRAWKKAVAKMQRPLMFPI